MKLTNLDRQCKLGKLATASGYGHQYEMLQEGCSDAVVPAICTSEDCDYVTEMEPDQDEGYCEACGGQTVQSALVIAELI